MQETPLRAHELSAASLLVDVGAGLLRGWVKPVSDVRACCEYNWVALWTSVILLDQQGQVVDFVKETDPGVAGGVMDGHFLGRVEPAEFERAWDVLGLFDARWARFSGRWDSSSHI